MALRDPVSGEFAAFTNVLPRYQSTDGNFDLMRRDPAAPNGVMDYLFVKLIERFRGEGLSGMNLGLAPFANIAGEGLNNRAMRFAYRHGDQAFNYRGLRAFKEKWNPRWEPRFLAYSPDADLAQTALAVVRAGELPDQRSRVQRIRRTLARLPVTLGVIGLVGWLTITTEVSAASFPPLRRHLGFSWVDLEDLQVWRLPTSQILPRSDELGLMSVLVLVVALVVAELRLGSRLTVAAFAFGGWAAALISIIGIRIGSLAGNAQMTAGLEQRISGSSPGAWALVLATAGSARRRRVRVVASAIPLVYLSALALTVREAAELRNLLGGIGGAVTMALVDRRRSSRASSQQRPAPTAPSVDIRPS